MFMHLSLSETRGGPPVALHHTPPIPPLSSSSAVHLPSSLKLPFVIFSVPFFALWTMHTYTGLVKSRPVVCPWRVLRTIRSSQLFSPLDLFEWHAWICGKGLFHRSNAHPLLICFLLITRPREQVIKDHSCVVCKLHTAYLFLLPFRHSIARSLARSRGPLSSNPFLFLYDTMFWGSITFASIYLISSILSLYTMSMTICPHHHYHPPVSWGVLSNYFQEWIWIWCIVPGPEGWRMQAQQHSSFSSQPPLYPFNSLCIPPL